MFDVLQTTCFMAGWFVALFVIFLHIITWAMLLKYAAMTIQFVTCMQVFTYTSNNLGRGLL